MPRPFADDLILQSLRQSGGGAVAVDDGGDPRRDRRNDRRRRHRRRPEGAATWAALKKMAEAGQVGADERIVLFNCGTGLKHPELRPQA